jgi:hypothetical protein
VLRDHDEPVLQEGRLEHYVPHAVLFAHLMLVCRIRLMVFDHAIEEIVGSRRRTRDE